MTDDIQGWINGNGVMAVLIVLAVILFLMLRK